MPLDTADDEAGCQVRALVFWIESFVSCENDDSGVRQVRQLRSAMGNVELHGFVPLDSPFNCALTGRRGGHLHGALVLCLQSLGKFAQPSTAFDCHFIAPLELSELQSHGASGHDL